MDCSLTWHPAQSLLVILTEKQKCNDDNRLLAYACRSETDQQFRRIEIRSPFFMSEAKQCVFDSC